MLHFLLFRRASLRRFFCVRLQYLPNVASDTASRRSILRRSRKEK
jgi:hypothetical protein